MKITIGKFDAGSRTVAARFVHAGVTHSRTVNAVLDAEGKYDKDATAIRIDEVALGVRHKIEIGAITDPTPPPEQP